MISRVVIPAVQESGLIRPSSDLPNSGLRVISANSDRYIVATGATGVFDAAMSAGAHGLQRLEALGANYSMDAISSGVPRVGFPIEGTDNRFEFTTDPDDPSRRVIAMRLSSTDPLTAGATRIELSHLGYAFPEGVPYTFAFSIRTGPMSDLDEQALFQLKSVATDPGNPFISLISRDSTEKWIIRHNSNSPPLQASNSVVDLGAMPRLPNTWYTYVVQCVRHWRADRSPFVRVWRNGDKVVDYSGPVSYNLVGDPSQCKVGIYHYTPPSWAEPLNRVMHVRGFYAWPELVDSDVASKILDSIG